MNAFELKRIQRDSDYWARGITHAAQQVKYEAFITGKVEELGTTVYALGYGAPARFDRDGWSVVVSVDYDEGMSVDDMGEPLTFDEAFGYCRECGASRSVASEEAARAVERWESRASEASAYVVRVDVYREGVRLGSDSLGGIFVLPDANYEAELWSAVLEHDMVENAIDDAKATLGRLCGAK